MTVTSPDRPARQAIHLTRRSALATLGIGLAAAGTGRYAAPAAAPPVPAIPPMTPTAVPPIVAHWAAAWETGDGAAMAALFTEDGLYEDLAFEGYSKGREQTGQWVAITVDTLTEIRAEITGAQEAGDRIGFEWVFSGRQTGPLFPDIAPSGREFRVRATTTFVMDGDLIRRDSDYYNLATVFRQLGLPADGYVPAGPLATPQT